MNTYKNKETDAIVLTDSELSGDWELVESTDKPKKKTQSKKVESDEE